MKLIIQDGRVVAEATDDYAGPMGWLKAPEGYVQGSFLLPGQQPPAPQEVTMAQCRLALFDMRGIETDAEFFALVDVLPESDRPRALLELRTRPTVQIDNPLVVAVCDSMGWDREALFRYASAQ